MTGVAARGGLREVTIEATVLGPCKHCGLGAEFFPRQPCVARKQHEPTFTRPLGVISSWHKSRTVRCWRAFKHKWKG